MRQLSSGIIGGLSVALTFGAIQLASGRDLTGLSTMSKMAVPSINRAAKSDREMVRGAQMPGGTFAIRLDNLPATSILVRVPAKPDRQFASQRMMGGLPSAPAFQTLSSKPPTTREGKLAVACEPVVSLLTEVAKRLQPGRCLT